MLIVNGISCKYNCSSPVSIVAKENFMRLWSNATQWPNGTLPAQGDDVLIPGAWQLELDINPPALNKLLVDGDLYFVDNRPLNNLTANLIWVRTGNLIAGTSTTPYQG